LPARLRALALWCEVGVAESQIDRLLVHGKRNAHTCLLA